MVSSELECVALLVVPVRMGACCSSSKDGLDSTHNCVAQSGHIVAGSTITTQEITKSNADTSTSDNIEGAPTIQNVISVTKDNSSTSLNALVARRTTSHHALPISVTSQNLAISTQSEPSSVELVDTKKLEEVFREMELPSSEHSF